MRSAVLSACGTYRYRLDRYVQNRGIVFAFFGINPSTADATREDQTTLKWRGFTERNDGNRYIVGNVFAYRATNVADLAFAPDPVGPENAEYLSRIITEAHVLVPCWGNRNKVPPSLRYRLDALTRRLQASGKPIRIFGLTASGDPKHPLMLGYDTPLVEWNP